jgi:hypothetical protein
MIAGYTAPLFCILSTISFAFCVFAPTGVCREIFWDAFCHNLVSVQYITAVRCLIWGGRPTSGCYNVDGSSKPGLFLVSRHANKQSGAWTPQSRWLLWIDGGALGTGAHILIYGYLLRYLSMLCTHVCTAITWHTTRPRDGAAGQIVRRMS